MEERVGRRRVQRRRDVARLMRARREPAARRGSRCVSAGIRRARAGSAGEVPRPRWGRAGPPVWAASPRSRAGYLSGTSGPSETHQPGPAGRRRRRSRARSCWRGAARRGARAGGGAAPPCRPRRRPGARARRPVAAGGAASSARTRAIATPAPVPLSPAAGPNGAPPSSSRSASARTRAAVGMSCTTPIGVPAVPPWRTTATATSQAMRDDQPARPPGGQRAGEPPQARHGRAQPVAIDQAGAPRVVVGGDDEADARRRAARGARRGRALAWPRRRRAGRG